MKLAKRLYFLLVLPVAAVFWVVPDMIVAVLLGDFDDEPLFGWSVFDED